MEQDYVEELVASKSKSSAILTKYINDHDEYPNKFFCFFEGEDYKYYRTRILQYLDIKEEEIFHYDCNGKKEVLKVYEDLLEDKKVKKLFFIDKDFDEDIKKEKVFQTDCYAIENYYVTDSAFRSFLSTEFDLNGNDKNFRKCFNDYRKIREKFNVSITKLNAYIYCMRKRDREEPERIKLPRETDILNKFIQKIEVDNIIEKPEKNIEEIGELLGDTRAIDKKEVIAKTKEFEQVKEKENVYRGKFEIYFIKKFVTSLVARIKANDYFEEYDKNIHIDINSNILTYMSTYAETPEKLKTFLLNLKKEYCDKKKERK